MSELGDLLRNLRGKESLRDAGKRTGLSHTYLSIIEKGFDPRSGKPVKPTPETLKLLSEAYNHPYEDLMIKAGYIEENTMFPKGNVFNLEKDFEELFLKNKSNPITTTVAGQEITISPEELRILEEIRKHPIMFHELAKDPEKNVKDLIKMWKFIKQDMLKEDNDEYFDEDIIED